MSINKGLLPRPSILILNLNHVGEGGSVVLLGQVLDGDGVVVVFAGKGLLRG